MVTGVDDEIKKEIRGKNGLDSLIPPYQKRKEAAIGKHVFTPLYIRCCRPEENYRTVLKMYNHNPFVIVFLVRITLSALQAFLSRNGCRDAREKGRRCKFVVSDGVFRESKRNLP